MATLDFSRNTLSDFFSGNFKHPGYYHTCKHAAAIALHAKGLFPGYMIEQRRPSESQAVFDYRCAIWKPITKKEIGKVITELNKIRRSQDWSIMFNDKAVPSIVKNSGSTLEDYLVKTFPVFSSITNWLFAVTLPVYLIDANALVVVMPRNFQVDENEFVRPFPYIIESPKVIAYAVDDYAIFESSDTCMYTVTDEEGLSYKYYGKVFYVVTTQTIRRYEQIDIDGSARLTSEYVHNLGYLPVTQTKGLVSDEIEGAYIYNSRISDMIPELDEAVREYSDLQAEVVNHIFSERWRYAQEDCPTCKGSGQEKNAGFSGYCGECRKCGGTGTPKRGPYTEMVVKAPILGEQKVPIPPAGYIQKDTKIVTIQDTRVFNHIYSALSAINMQFLAQVPLSISGEAKNVDRDALNTFVNSIAEDLVSIADNVAKFVCDMRYQTIVTDQKARDAMLPTIPVPENFDLLSADYLLKEISSAQANSLSPVLIDALQKDYASKKFNADPKVRQQLELTLKLDPLSGITEDDKLIRLSAKGITLKTYIVSSNITEYIERAMDEKADAFFGMSLKDQKDLLSSYADEQIQLAPASLIAPDPTESETIIA